MAICVSIDQCKPKSPLFQSRRILLLDEASQCHKDWIKREVKKKSWVFPSLSSCRISSVQFLSLALGSSDRRMISISCNFCFLFSLLLPLLLTCWDLTSMLLSSRGVKKRGQGWMHAGQASSPLDLKPTPLLQLVCFIWSSWHLSYLSCSVIKCSYFGSQCMDAAHHGGNVMEKRDEGGRVAFAVKELSSCFLFNLEPHPNNVHPYLGWAFQSQLNQPRQSLSGIPRDYLV